MQVLYHIATAPASVNSGIYTTADLDSPIDTRLIFDQDIMHAWQFLLLTITSEWESICEQQLTDLPPEAFKRAVDIETVKMTRKLREALARQGWYLELGKSGVDVQSRLLKHIQV